MKPQSLLFLFLSLICTGGVIAAIVARGELPQRYPDNLWELQSRIGGLRSTISVNTGLWDMEERALGLSPTEIELLLRAINPEGDPAQESAFEKKLREKGERRKEWLKGMKREIREAECELEQARRNAQRRYEDAASRRDTFNGIAAFFGMGAGASFLAFLLSLGHPRRRVMEGESGTIDR